LNVDNALSHKNAVHDALTRTYVRWKQHHEAGFVSGEARLRRLGGSRIEENSSSTLKAKTTNKKLSIKIKRLLINN